VTGGELIAAHPRAWGAATRHPFLDAVRDDELPDVSFRVWLQQDHHFLRDLLNFQASLLSIAPQTARGLLAAGIAAIAGELAWFADVAEELSLALDAPRQPVTDAYAEFFSSVGGGFSTGLTALWVGERAYLEAWRSARSGSGRYQRLVEHWTTPEFETYVRELETLLGPEGDKPTFLTACRLEHAFWEMAWASAMS
jgi:formylaminopyrimidine deformylase / aminopyrimidine aminohydrolase